MCGEEHRFHSTQKSLPNSGSTESGNPVPRLWEQPTHCTAWIKPEDQSVLSIQDHNSFVSKQHAQSLATALTSNITCTHCKWYKHWALSSVLPIIYLPCSESQKPVTSPCAWTVSFLQQGSAVLGTNAGTEPGVQTAKNPVKRLMCKARRKAVAEQQLAPVTQSAFFYRNLMHSSSLASDLCHWMGWT